MFNNCYNNINVLITGHTGFKGAWLTFWLNQLGANITGYSLDAPTKSALLDILLLRHQITDVHGDILDANHLDKIYHQENPDIIFHLAAEPIVSTGYAKPQQTFMTNTLGTMNILEQARYHKNIKAIVIVTSDKCYDNTVSDHPFREDDKLGGRDPYSASKACCEIVTQAYYHSFFINSSTAMATARAGNVIGGGDWGKDRIVPDCIRAWSTQQSVKLRNPRAIRPWIYVLDVLAGYLALGEKLLNHPEKFSGQAFNFGPSNEGHTTLSLVKALQKTWPEGQWLIESENAMLPETQRYQLDSKKSLKTLDWQPTINFNQTSQLTAEWYRHYYNSPASILDYSLQQIKQHQQRMKESPCL